MPTISVHSDPSNITKADITTVDNGTSLIDWMYDNINLDSLGCTVLLNGREVADIDKQDADSFIQSLSLRINADDCVQVIMRPRDPGTIAYIVVAIVAAAAAIVLTPKPQIPNDSGKRSESPNNQLNAATNAFRPRQAIPDIAGQVRSYPDFIQPSHFEYVDNLKIVKEIFCIGVGQYDVDEIKTGETLISGISGSSATVHPPGSAPSELLNVRGTNEIDGQELVPPDDSSVGYSGQYTILGNQVFAFGRTARLDMDLAVGDDVQISFNGTDSVTGDPVNVSGIYTVTEATSPGAFEVDQSIGTANPSTGDGFVSKVNTARDQWFTLEGDAIEQVWFQIQMPQGIKGEDDNTISVLVNVEIEELDANDNPTGDVTSQSVTFSGNTLDPQFKTVKITGLTPSRYRARAKRSTGFEPSPGVDKVIIEDIQSVTSYSGENFGDVTLLEVDRRATTFAVSQRQSKINALVTRKLELFDRNTGQVQTGVFTATRSFADYVFYVLHQQAGVPISDIDTDALFGIYDNLSDERLGYFDFTFDDSDVGFRERLTTACNAARVRYYNTPSPVWNFVREEANQVRSAMFNRRNIISGNSSQAYRFQRTADYDSVSIRYVDPDTNSEAVIEKRWNPSTGQIEIGRGFRANEIDLAGCRNPIQADNRANLEMRKIIYQRRTINDKFMRDAQFIGLGERAQWADPNDTQIFSGEILGVNGSKYDTSERFNPESGKTYYVNVTDENGAVIGNTVVATPRTDTPFGFIASGLSGVYLADGEKQLGSKYFIYEDGELTDITITSIGRPDKSGNVPIEGVEYRSEVFADD